MPGQYILAHDLGTTGNKASLYDRDGRMVASSFFGYGLELPHVNWVEQNPEDWWQAVCASTRQLLAAAKVQPEEIACITFSGQMMGCVVVDRRARPLRNALDLGRHARRGRGADDHRRRRHGGGVPDHRPPGQLILLRGQDPVGAQPPARDLRPGAQVPPRQGLHRRPADGQLRHRLLRRVGHEPVRPPGRRLVGPDPGRDRAGSRGPAGAPRLDRRRRRGDGGRGRGGRPGGRHAGGDRRRRRLLRGDGRGRRARGQRLQLHRLVVVDRARHESAHPGPDHAHLHLGAPGAGDVQPVRDDAGGGRLVPMAARQPVSAGEGRRGRSSTSAPTS